MDIEILIRRAAQALSCDISKTVIYSMFVKEGVSEEQAFFAVQAGEILLAEPPISKKTSPSVEMVALW